MQSHQGEERRKEKKKKKAGRPQKGSRVISKFRIAHGAIATCAKGEKQHVLLCGGLN